MTEQHKPSRRPEEVEEQIDEVSALDNVVRNYQDEIDELLRNTTGEPSEEQKERMDNLSRKLATKKRELNEAKEKLEEIRQEVREG